MEFWGVEVKIGQSLSIDPGDSKIVHLSQASLGEVKKDKGSEPVHLYLKVGDKKLVLGTLSAEKIPQWSFDLVVERDFELSHTWKNGSVFFTGYKVHMEEGTDDDEKDNFDSDEEVKEIPLVNNGKPELQAKPVSEKPNATEPDAATTKINVKDVKINQKADDSDSDNANMDVSSSDDDENTDEEHDDFWENLSHVLRDSKLVKRETGSDESSEEGESDEEDDDEDSDEGDSDDEDKETPKKTVQNRKRPADSATKTPLPDKKTKFVTPQKTEGKKVVDRTATPHPSKQFGKTPANNDQKKPQAQKPGGSYPCKSCNRSFTTEMGMQAHMKAKHSAVA